jgi:hypothetical protein
LSTPLSSSSCSCLCLSLNNGFSVASKYSDCSSSPGLSPFAITRFSLQHRYAVSAPNSPLGYRAYFGSDVAETNVTAGFVVRSTEGEHCTLSCCFVSLFFLSSAFLAFFRFCSSLSCVLELLSDAEWPRLFLIFSSGFDTAFWELLRLNDSVGGTLTCELEPLGGDFSRTFSFFSEFFCSVSELLDDDSSLFCSASTFTFSGLGDFDFFSSSGFTSSGSFFVASSISRLTLFFTVFSGGSLTSGANVICSRFGLWTSWFSFLSLLLCFNMLFVLSSFTLGLSGGGCCSLFCSTLSPSTALFDGDVCAGLGTFSFGTTRISNFPATCKNTITPRHFRKPTKTRLLQSLFAVLVFHLGTLQFFFVDQIENRQAAPLRRFVQLRFFILLLEVARGNVPHHVHPEYEIVEGGLLQQGRLQTRSDVGAQRRSGPSPG